MCPVTITIAARLRPYSHVPGISCLIPGTLFEAVIFPALIRIMKDNHIIKEYPIDIKGPLAQFTVFQDLERGCITISSEDYFFHLLPDLQLINRKHPGLPPIQTQERLSLGSHKKQEWEDLKKRCDFRAIFPIWHRLGMFYSDLNGHSKLVEECQEAIQSNNPENIVQTFRKLFLAGFRNILVPRLKDDDHQGIISGNTISNGETIYLLSKGARIIRSLFIQEVSDRILILPALPPEFFAGRMTEVKTNKAIVNLEWSKKLIRRLSIHALADGTLNLNFQSQIKKYRLRTARKERGCMFFAGDPVEIKSGTFYLLDQFQK